jgi:hypothetical protein
MWLIKFAMWIFLKRMMHGKWMIRFANFVFVFLIVSYLAINIFNLAWCAPIQSMLEVQPSSIILVQLRPNVQVARFIFSAF